MNMKLSDLKKFDESYRHKAISILNTMIVDIRNGYDTIGSIGSLIDALSNIRKVRAEMEYANERNI